MSQQERPLGVGDVFVPGGSPTITYNPRSDLQLEAAVQEYLMERHKILSVSGPTKSGKTVLLRNTVPDAIKLTGGSIHTLDDFWEATSDQLQLYPSETRVDEETASTGTRSASEGSFKPQGMGAAHTKADESTRSKMRHLQRSRKRPLHIMVTEEMVDNRHILVIDDFHYIDRSLQLTIIRALKEPVFEGLGVILSSVPHRAFDSVRVEREMTGRVEQLTIPAWSHDELRIIANEGFPALGLTDANGVGDRLASESFGSPFLMQDFCLQLCKANNVFQTQRPPVELSPPSSWRQFYADRATVAAKTEFDRLAAGPPRTDRIGRTLKDGREVDIYRVVLEAIGRAAPEAEITYADIAVELRRILADDPPQQHEVTRVLDKMSEIAKESDTGEPVVDWDPELRKLHISDPYFAFYLRHGKYAETD